MKIIQIIIFIFFSIASNGKVVNDKHEAIVKISAAGKLLEDEKITLDNYFDTVTNSALQVFASGSSFENKELLDLLQPYQILYLKNEQYDIYKSKFYTLLANNAQVANRTGESLYYLDKIGQLKGSSDGDKIKILAKKSTYFCLSGYLDKGKNLYLSNEQLINKVYFECLKKKDSAKLEATIFYLLNSSCNTFAQLNDSFNCLKTLKIAKDLFEIAKNKLPKENIGVISYLVGSMEYYYAELIKKDFTSCKTIINNLEYSLKKDSFLSDQWKQMIFDNISSMKISYFIGTKQNDSARRRIMDINKGSILSPPIVITNNYNVSRLYENELNYKQAYYSLKVSKLLLDTLNAQLGLELNDLLYAYTDAEYNKVKLNYSEKVIKRRNILVGLISTIAAIVITIIVIIMNRKAKKARKQIENLNSITEFQIAEMEDIKNMAISGEQKKLGMDLHDGLASTLASIKNNIELLSFDINTEKEKQVLNKIQSQINLAYLAVRNKSHSLYEIGNKDLEMQFERRINTIMSNAFPDPSFNKEVLIDANVCENLNIDTQIEILKIIQEAIVNIIKHSKASKVSVLIYEDENQIILNIEDNGVGFNYENQNKSKNNFGLNSMKNRAKNLGGLLNINSNNKGTQVEIRFPKKNK